MIAISVEKMRELEIRAIKELNIPSILLMENAAYGFVSALKSFYGDLAGKSICVACGKGNNGGDGYAIARLLKISGASVELFSVCDTTQLTGDAKTNFEIAKNIDIQFVNKLENKYDIIVDAIFGTGFHGEVQKDIADIFERINESSAFIASVDIPSGVCADSGQGEDFIFSDLCVTFGYAKVGQFLFPAKNAYKKLVVVPISIPETDEGINIITDDGFSLIPKRNSNSHKGTFGKSLAFVGSKGMSGAAILSGSAILKSGAGIATVAVAEDVIPTLAHRFPSVMTYPIPTENGDICENAASLILEKSEDMDSVLIGCGLGKSENTKKAVFELIKNLEIPTVIDADGLNILSENIDLLKGKKNIILTPHIVEFSRLSGYKVSEIKENPIELSRKFAKEYGVTLILKDAITIIADKSGNAAICPAVNSGMATAGSGDVLAGIVAGLLSQGMAPFLASVLSVYLHSSAGRIAAKNLGEYSMTSEDILDNVSKAFLSPQNITPDIKEL